MKTTKDSERMEREKNFSLIRNLKDAGCGASLRAEIIALHESGNIREELRLLAHLRSALLEKLHAEQKKIDCLDYLIFHMKQENTFTAGR